MTPQTVIRAGWLDDPVARAAGVGVVALVLALAARAADRGTPGILDATDWTYHVDPRDADRAERAGLVAREPLASGGVVFRCSDWVLVQLDTDKAISDRRLTRLRVQRLRQRRQLDADGAQLRLQLVGGALPLFDIPTRTPQPARAQAKTAADQVAAVNGLPCGKTCGKPVDATVDVTVDVTPDATKKCMTYISARTPARAVRLRQDQINERIHVRQKSSTPPPAPFRHVLAMVAAARADDPQRTPLTRDAKRQLLQSVRTVCASARLSATDAAIGKAIAIDGRRRA